MTDRLREQISALADDSLLESEHELLVRRFGADTSLRACWERYHLIGEAMRKGLPQVDTRGFADRVMAALDASGPRTSDTPRASVFTYMSKALAGMAVAASVAAVAVIGLRHDNNHINQSASAPSEIVPSNAQQLNATPASYGTVSNATWNGNTPDVQAQLSNYLINHNEMAASLSQPGIAPYFYTATYDSRPRVKQPQASNGQKSVNQDIRNRR